MTGSLRDGGNWMEEMSWLCQMERGGGYHALGGG